MKYAVLQTGGKQYKVEEESVIEIDRLDKNPGDKFVFENVLMYVEDGVVSLGQPNLGNISITAEVIDQVKGTKIRVAKFKAKARYRKVQGHRQSLTKVKITKIALGKAKETQTSKDK